MAEPHDRYVGQGRAHLRRNDVVMHVRDREELVSQAPDVVRNSDPAPADVVGEGAHERAVDGDLVIAPRERGRERTDIRLGAGAAEEVLCRDQDPHRRPVCHRCIVCTSGVAEPPAAQGVCGAFAEPSSGLQLRRFDRLRRSAYGPRRRPLPEGASMTTVAAAPDTPVRSGRPPRILVLWAIALAGVGLAAATIALGVRNDGEAIQIALLVWISLPYVLVGLVAWWRRPASRLGVLMVAGGLASGLSGLQFSQSELVFTVGSIFDILPAAVFLHVYLAFPDGRLRSSFERVLVLSTYVAALGLQLLKMALGSFPNLLQVTTRPDAALAVERVQLYWVAAACLAGLGLLAARRRAGRPRRRSVALLIDSFALGLVMIAFVFVVAALPDVGLPFVRLRQAMLFVIGLSPIVFLIGLLDARLARSAIGDLVVELRGDLAPAALEDAIARALRDPSLTLAYLLPDYERYADLEGRPVEVPTHDGRATTLIDSGSEHVAVLLHDPALEDEPELLDAVGAAAAIAL